MNFVFHHDCDSNKKKGRDDFRNTPFLCCCVYAHCARTMFNVGYFHNTAHNKHSLSRRDGWKISEMYNNFYIFFFFVLVLLLDFDVDSTESREDMNTYIVGEWMRVVIPYSCGWSNAADCFIGIHHMLVFKAIYVYPITFGFANRWANTECVDRAKKNESSMDSQLKTYAIYIGFYPYQLYAIYVSMYWSDSWYYFQFRKVLFDQLENTDDGM